MPKTVISFNNASESQRFATAVAGFGQLLRQSSNMGQLSYAQVAQIAQQAKGFDNTGAKAVNLAAAPMTHTAGILSLPTTMRGGTVVVVTRPDPQLMLAAIPKHRVTELFLPPTVIYRLL